MLLFPILDDASTDLFFHLFTMSGLLQECEEIILEKHLEFSILNDLDRRIAEIISDESNLSEESTCLQCSEFFFSLEYAYFA